MTAEFELYKTRLDAFTASPKWDRRVRAALKQIGAEDSRRNYRLLDFGCGMAKAYQTATMLRREDRMAYPPNLAPQSRQQAPSAGATQYRKPENFSYTGVECGEMFEYLQDAPIAHLISSSLFTVPFDNYDGALLHCSLAHVADPLWTLKTIYNRLRVFGYIVVVTNNVWYGRIMALHNRMTGYVDDPTIRHRWSAMSLKKLMWDAGFELIRAVPVEDERFLGVPYYLMAVGRKP